MINKFEELFDLSLDDAARALTKAVNYGDYLAEEKKNHQVEALRKKELMREQILVAKSDPEICSASDAKARIEQAEFFAQPQVKEFQQAEIETEYVSDLFKNNHDRIESLRSLMSAKRQNLSDTNRNPL